MKLLYSDVEFTAISDFTIWVGNQNLQFWEDDGLFGIRIFLINLGCRGILDDVEKADYLLDAAVYPEWKQIQKKSPNDNLYDQLIQFVKFYQSDFGFDMSPLMTILEQEEIKEEFDKRLKNS